MASLKIKIQNNFLKTGTSPVSLIRKSPDEKNSVALNTEPFLPLHNEKKQSKCGYRD